MGDGGTGSDLSPTKTFFFKPCWEQYRWCYVPLDKISTLMDLLDLFYTLFVFFLRARKPDLLEIASP